MTAAGQKAASRERISQQHMDEVRNFRRDRMFSQRKNLIEEERKKL